MATGPLVRLAVRARLRAELGRGRSRKQVDDLMAGVTDEAIDDAATRTGFAAPGDGSLLKWLADHADEIMRIVALILAALGK